jgi:hypothetical protein
MFTVWLEVVVTADGRERRGREWKFPGAYRSAAS